MRTQYLHPKISVMLKRLLALVFVFAVFNVYADDTLSISSPSHLIQVNIYHQTDGQVKYSAYYKQKFFIKPSGLAMRFSTPDVLLNKFDVVRSDHSQLD